MISRSRSQGACTGVVRLFGRVSRRKPGVRRGRPCIPGSAVHAVPVGVCCDAEKPTRRRTSSVRYEKNKHLVVLLPVDIRARCSATPRDGRAVNGNVARLQRGRGRGGGGPPVQPALPVGAAGQEAPLVAIQRSEVPQPPPESRPSDVSAPNVQRPVHRVVAESAQAGRVRMPQALCRSGQAAPRPVPDSVLRPLGPLRGSESERGTPARTEDCMKTRHPNNIAQRRTREEGQFKKGNLPFKLLREPDTKKRTPHLIARKHANGHK